MADGGDMRSALPWATWLRLCGDLDLPYRVQPRTCTLCLRSNRGCTNDAENPTIFPRGAPISYKHSYRCTRESAKQMGDQEGDKF